MDKTIECKQLDDFRNELNILIKALEVDADKFYNKEQKAAGVRLRKGYKAIKNYVESVSKETAAKKVN